MWLGSGPSEVADARSPRIRWARHSRVNGARPGIALGEASEASVIALAVAGDDAAYGEIDSAGSRKIARDARLRSPARAFALVSTRHRCIVAAAVAAPFVASVSVDLVRYGGGGTQRFADLLVSPVGGAASFVVAFFVLSRVRALRRLFRHSGGLAHPTKKPPRISRGVRSLACVWRSVLLLLFNGLVSDLQSCLANPCFL